MHYSTFIQFFTSNSGFVFIIFYLGWLKPRAPEIPSRFLRRVKIRTVHYDAVLVESYLQVQERYRFRFKVLGITFFFFFPGVGFRHPFQHWNTVSLSDCYVTVQNFSSNNNGPSGLNFNCRMSPCVRTDGRFVEVKKTTERINETFWEKKKAGKKRNTRRRHWPVP